MKTRDLGRFYKLFPPPSSLTTDRYIKIPFLVGLTFLFLQLGLLVAAERHLPPEVPLFYSHPWGKLQLAPKTTLWLLPFSTALVFILNLSLANFVHHQEQLLARILMGVGVSFAFLATYTLTKIAMLVWY